MIGRVRVSSQETTSAIAVATMNRPVAMKIGPPNAAKRRELSGQPFAARVGEEEDQQRPELQRQLQSGLISVLRGSAGSRSRIGLLMACSFVSSHYGGTGNAGSDHFQQSDSRKNYPQLGFENNGFHIAIRFVCGFISSRIYSSQKVFRTG